MESYITNLVGRARRVSRNGREYLVASTAYSVVRRERWAALILALCSAVNFRPLTFSRTPSSCLALVAGSASAALVAWACCTLSASVALAHRFLMRSPWIALYSSVCRSFFSLSRCCGSCIRCRIRSAVAALRAGSAAHIASCTSDRDRLCSRLYTRDLLLCRNPSMFPAVGQMLYPNLGLAAWYSSIHCCSSCTQSSGRQRHNTVKVKAVAPCLFHDLCRCWLQWLFFPSSVLWLVIRLVSEPVVDPIYRLPLFLLRMQYSPEVVTTAFPLRLGRVI
jgi:hypothetical protein